MMEEFYFNAYETELIGGEIGRAHHFLSKSAKGKGFYAEVSKVLLSAIERRIEPEEIEDEILRIPGEELEKRAIYFRFLYSYNRYDVAFPAYDTKRCNDL